MVNVGIDIGSVSVKIAVVGDEEDREVLRDAAERSPNFSLVDEKLYPKPILISAYRRIKGEPLKATFELLDELYRLIPEIHGIRVTGVGARLIAEPLNAPIENDFKAAARGVGELYPEVRTIFEMGGDISKYILIERDESGRIGIVDYERNGECAAGTGSFMDQQASRLKYDIEEVGDIVLKAGKPPTIAGRCSVFAKSDMIHAQQRGYQPPEILKGLCEAVVRNFKGTITKGKKIIPKVAFIGGVAANKGVVQAMKQIFELSDDEFFVPEYYAWMGAIGAALIEAENPDKPKLNDISALQRRSVSQKASFPTMKPLSMEKVILLRDMVKPYSFEGKKLPVDAYLGIDVGSVSTNFAVLDENGDLIMEIYTRTQSRPIEVVKEGLKRIEEEIGDKIRIRGVGTTGSGRELIGKLVGADVIKDEITAHKTGATFVGRKLINRVPDTIFEIGGQDSKFISIQEGVVVDFSMNEACAAGTGSFLEEQAEQMGISIVGEFAQLALSSKAPLRLGERCTVFMEKDVISYLQRGADKADICAGLAYSIAINYLNRVVRGRRIGDTIFFQGGTAYNDAVAAAFATLLDKEIIVPPHNGVIGAIGAALLAMEKIKATGEKTKFRGFDLSKVKYKLREFTCKGCSNFCDIQMFIVEGEVTFWGDKCSDRYRKHVKSEKEPVIPDLMKLRQELLMREYEPGKHDGPKVGFPRAMYFYDRFPFWAKLFDVLGVDLVISDPTNKKIVTAGSTYAVAEPCFPIKVAHGHVADLLEKGVDFVLLPNVINAETEFPQLQSHLCPWGQTMTYVIGHSPLMEGKEGMILRPRIHFRDGIEKVKREIYEGLSKKLGISKKLSDKAVEAAYEAQRRFEEDLVRLGIEALKKLDETGEMGIVLVGRPYNINDSGINLDVPRKMRDYYGVNVIPLDMLPIKGIDISDVNENMYWNYGRKILQAAKFVRNRPNLHLIHITNFKCGPDSYIKHFIRLASGKPYLTLQIDEHANDAGILTRIEAYLDSKGFLRWWLKKTA
ncbi:hypothetical protein DRP77_04265 [Candidatus Poribacteria bacterium]|nr:MAG: hypothetical protein DRP77_04265 [Candidatus Poribacteria bacterium]